MKLMAGMTKWAITIQGSGDSQGWARLLRRPSANTVSCERDRAGGEKKCFFFFKVRQEDNRGRETSDGRRMHKGWGEKGGDKRECESGWERER